MWLLLARKKQISLYKRVLEPSASRETPVTPAGKRIKLFSTWSFILHNASDDDLDALVRRFIKKRYHLSLKHEYLSTEELYNCILDEEIKRISY